MNCTICKRPLEEHLEGCQTDKCVAEKLGYEARIQADEVCNFLGFMRPKQTNLAWEPTPHYSSPEMSAETWSLVERIGVMEINNIPNPPSGDDWQLVKISRGEEPYYVYDINAPTPTLAICRAFLAMEEE